MVKARVLIVDDEQEFATALAERMQTRGLEAEAVFNGDDAIARIKSKSYDAVVLDLGMPGLDGMETLKIMLSINKDIQVIILTGQATITKGIAAVKEGAFEFLEKPVKLDALVDKVSQAKSRGADLSESRMNDMIDEIMKRRAW